MSTVRRLFDDPKNSESRDGRRVQVCCEGRAPYWDTYRIHDDKDEWLEPRNMTAYKQSSPLQVQDATGESDNLEHVVRYDANGKVEYDNRQLKGYCWVEGPYSGYKPDFIDGMEWMRWQGVHWIPSPTPTPGLPNPPRWVRLPGHRKVRWGKGQGSWGANDYLMLWCPKCETALESAWSNTLEVLPTVARGIALVVSNVPVFGTAISFIINTAVTLAEGDSLDNALLDGIAGALPGQPTSGIAFRAGVAIAKGERFDQVVIDSLPVDRVVKDVLKTAADVIYGIASGENVGDVVYDVIRARMPPNAQKAMDYARRVIQGENIPEMILDEAEQLVVERVRTAALNASPQVARSLYNQYAAEAGYQAALSELTTEQRDAVSTGLVCGNAIKAPFIGTFGSVPEKNVSANNSFEEQGRQLIASGISWRGRKLSDILKGTTFTITIQDYDALNSRWIPVKKTYTIDDAWRRGFTIAIGVCQGMSQRGPGQTAVYQTMAEAGGRAGFDAGQAVQHERTLSESAAPSGLYPIVARPPIQYLATTKPALFTEEAQEASATKKAIERGSWVAYYRGMVEQTEPFRDMSG